MISSKDRIIDILWSPSKNDDFIIYENDISLYRLKCSKQSKSDGIFIFYLNYSIYARFLSLSLSRLNQTSMMMKQYVMMNIVRLNNWANIH
jgi:hypothetical protein